MGADKAFQRHPALRVEALTVCRGGRTLIEALSFAAHPGGYVEIRGANGAGKTSLLRAIAGFLRPTAGRVVVEPCEERELALHYLGHRNALKLATSVRAHAQFWAGLLGGAGNLTAAIETVGLQRAMDVPARALSQGQQRRLAISRLLVARRPIWLLDEPSAALDAAGREMLLAILAEHRAAGGLALAAVHEPLGAAPDVTLTLGA